MFGRSKRVWCLVLFVWQFAPSEAASQTVLFRDDFNGTSLNTANWNVADYTFGGNRAYFGNTPTVAGGLATLRLDTFNPDHVGFFRGTEIFSATRFARGTAGVEFEARVRTNMTTRGAVTSVFTYAQTPPANHADEMDFEFVTNQINGQATNHNVLTSSWNDWGAPGSAHNDGVHHQNANPAVAGLNLTDFNTVTIRWLPDRVDWLVNGALVASESGVLPDAATPIRMNFWPPDASWAAAYDAGLQPANSAAANVSFTYDLDYVEVRTVPVPEPGGVLLAAAAVGAAGLRRWRSGARTVQGSGPS